VGRCRLSEVPVASDLRRQYAKEAGDRGPNASVEVSIAGFRGIFEFGLGVVSSGDNLVFFRMELDADHKTGFRGAGPGEPENRDMIPSEIQAGGRQALLHGLTESFQGAGFQAVKGTRRWPRGCHPS
jgi:hypothetical protein